MIPYRIQSYDELSQQLEARGLPKPISTAKRGTKLTKADLIQTLQRADEEPTGMSSLPPETMRRICEELLVFKDGKRTCHPQILSTCKGIKQSASELLYGLNAIEVYITYYKVTVHGTACGRFDAVDCITKLEWPDYLRKIEHIEVTVDLRSTPRYRSRLNHIFYSLYACLSRNNHLKTLGLDLRSLNLNKAEPLCMQILAPLMLLQCHRKKTARLSDLDTIHIQHSTLHASAEPRPPSVGVLTNAISIAKEAQSYLDLTRHRAPAGFPGRNHSQDTFAINFDDSYFRLRMLLDSSKFYDVAWEKSTLLETQVLRRALTDLRIPALIEEYEQHLQQVTRSLADLKSRREVSGAEAAETGVHRERHQRRRREYEAQIEHGVARRGQEGQRMREEAREREGARGLAPPLVAPRGGGVVLRDPRREDTAGEERRRANEEGTLRPLMHRQRVGGFPHVGGRRHPLDPRAARD